MARDPDLRRSWLFGPGADAVAHDTMQHSGADVLIADLEDSTPPPRRPEARQRLPALARRWREAGCMVATFEAARARGEDRALVEGLWVEVPTHRNALRLLERAQRLRGIGAR